MHAHQEAQSKLNKELLQRLQRIDRRSRWEVGLAASSLAVMVALIASAVAGARNYDLSLSAPAPMFFGSLLLLLLLTWLVHDRTRANYVAQFRGFLQEARISEHQDSSIRDPLTGLYNRVALEEYCQRVIKQCERSHEALTLVVFDLDHFHDLNNKYGHIAGDLALTQFAGILQASTRGSDFAARFGGDEFVLLLPDTNEAGYEVVLGRIRGRIEALNSSLGKGEAPISFTPGRAESRKGMSFRDLFGEADTHMMAQKRARPGAPEARA